MNKKWILGAIILLFAGILPIGAQTVYVYRTAENQTYLATRKIVFAGTDMSVVATDGTATTVGYNLLKKFSLKDFNENFVITSNSLRTKAEYVGGDFNDIIFNGTAQLEIPEDETVKVNGVVKVNKTYDVQKWYAVGFPFDIAEIHSDHETYPDLTAWNGNEGSFWAKIYDGVEDEFNDYANGSVLEAGGYALQFPSILLNKTITFVSDPYVSLSNSDAFDVTANGYKLTVNPSVANTNITPEDANKYYILDINQAGNFGLLTAGNASSKTFIAPFESLVVANNISSGNLRSSLAVETPTGIKLRPLLGEEPIAVHYYNLQGVKITQPQRGSVYLIKTVFQSGKSEVCKSIIR
ncbi:MAG: hypothetical protein LBS25_03835 [Candidatus Symbiothrix sp.]|jgi:hypothetical protein|nr:hypothetical protein [Candidatus Symbiothrix sp.]